MIQLALLIVLAGCGERAAADYLAVGWTGSMPTSMGPCRAKLDATTPVQDTGYAALLAVTTGEMTFDCRDGALTVHVVRPTQLTITPLPATRAGAVIVASASASAGTQNLALGDAVVVWTLPAGLRQTEACTNGTCLKPSSTRFIASAAGTYEIKAQFGGLAATATVVVN